MSHGTKRTMIGHCLERETLLSDFSGRLSETFPGNTDQSR